MAECQRSDCLRQRVRRMRSMMWSQHGSAAARPPSPPRQSLGFIMRQRRCYHHSRLMVILLPVLIAYFNLLRIHDSGVSALGTKTFSKNPSTRTSRQITLAHSASTTTASRNSETRAVRTTQDTSIKSSSSPLPPQHYSSRRRVTNRKTQLRWIAQRVQKIQSRQRESTTTEIDTDTSTVVEAITLLSTARTVQQVLGANRMLESVAYTQSVAIQERIVKAAALTGLLQLAVNVTQYMLEQHNHVPLTVCQDALCNGLRQAGRAKTLERVLCQLGAVALEQDRRVSSIAFNTYLAALCDIVMDRDATVAQRSDAPQSSSTVRSFHTKVQALEQAWTWLRHIETTQSQMAVTPDTVAYATVMQAAGSVGNFTLVDAIWDTMKERGVQPNIVAYNARLRTMSDLEKEHRARRQKQQQQHQENNTNNIIIAAKDATILRVWDEEISKDPHVQPDKYTIDNLLLPLIRAGRIGDVEALLDTFVQRNSDRTVSNAFAAFLLNIVGGGELASARALFETYILPTLSPFLTGDAVVRMVRPTTRHFNTLLEGYRRRVQNGRFDKATVKEVLMSDLTEAWKLYRIMFASHGVRPDGYTLTTMMGLCRNSTELSELLVEATSELNIQLSSVVLRAACKS